MCIIPKGGAVAKTFYDVLQVTPNAEPEIITAAHNSLIQRFYPDKNSGNPESENYLKIINRAYEVLSDPEKRARYDASIAAADDVKAGQATIQKSTPAPATEQVAPACADESVNSSTPARATDQKRINGKVAKGMSWLKTVMILWAALVGFKILAAFGQANPARGIVEAIFLFMGAFVVTGIPAFILGWATGKDEV